MDDTNDYNNVVKGREQYWLLVVKVTANHIISLNAGIVKGNVILVPTQEWSEILYNHMLSYYSLWFVQWLIAYQ